MIFRILVQILLFKLVSGLLRAVVFLFFRLPYRGLKALFSSPPARSSQAAHSSQSAHFPR